MSKLHYRVLALALGLLAAVPGVASAGEVEKVCPASVPTLEVRCGYTLVTDGGVFVTAAVGFTVEDTQGNPVFPFDTGVGTTGAGASNPGTPVQPTGGEGDVLFEEGQLYDLFLIGRSPEIAVPSAGVIILPNGLSVPVRVNGGGGTLTVTPSCVLDCDGEPAEAGAVYFN